MEFLGRLLWFYCRFKSSNWTIFSYQSAKSPRESLCTSWRWHEGLHAKINDLELFIWSFFLNTTFWILCALVFFFFFYSFCVPNCNERWAINIFTSLKFQLCGKPYLISCFAAFNFFLKWTFILLLSLSLCVGEESEESPTSSNNGKYLHYLCYG